MIYKYNEAAKNYGHIIGETDDYIEYELNEKEVPSSGLEEVSCRITGADIMKKNVNYIYHKIIVRLIEVYDEDVSNFINKYFKSLVKHEIRSTILKVNFPKHVLKNKTFYSLYNLENLNKRIAETLMQDPEALNRENDFFTDFESYAQSTISFMK